LQNESWEADIGREDRGRRPIAYPRGSGSPSLEGGTGSRKRPSVAKAAVEGDLACQGDLVGRVFRAP
jgi:hypothetical protein